MSAGLFGIATSGLNAAQRALDTTGHNIANVNTEGYSRQRTEQGTRPAQFSGAGYVGRGVDVNTVRRMYDEFVQTQLRNNTTSSEFYNTQKDFISRVDNLLADPAAGLSPGLQQFFSATQELANDPTSSANRTVLISEAESLVDRFKFLDQRLKDQQTIVDGQIGSGVDEVNGYADSIAKLNQQIVAAQGRGQPPNDLLDKRDQMVLEMSKFVDVRTTIQDDGSMNVFIGRGQGVVLGNKATPLSASRPTPGAPLEVNFGAQGGNKTNVTNLISGGKLGGLLELRSSVLDEAQNELGRVAVAVAVGFNNQHQAGLDLDGNPGEAFFKVPRPEVLSASGNTAEKPKVTIDPEGLSELTSWDYRMTREGGNWVLNTVPGSSPQTLDFTSGDPVRVAGMLIDEPTGGADEGDSFLIRPTRNAAQQMQVNITEPDKLAAAAGWLPDDSAPAIDSLSVVDPSALPPMGTDEVNFASGDFTEISAGAGVWKAVSEGIELVVRSDDPAGPGDVKLNRNTDPGPGDNRNGLALAQVQATGYLDGGKSSIEDTYNGLIGKVGTKTRQAQVAADSQARLLADAKAQRESLSGVNLDEEAANLLKFQQAYQASAQVIAVTSTLFDTLIGVARR
ncbi:flagellar hook-associated protein FlgK [Ectothiorhodospira variabilis]|uniref:flagellar hook-associated protein FlgK n=1 Tax=Ectothiorhodospira variabilis TaxID=505694 RepID=UPI001EFBEB27|nr:flagellar hook-associated protein FlgK [Ectothiorhodospira variabilis]MCG5493046.1 flagellar hook-associated protein FlgK [Ectothiorhodospira variabilis]MCG5502375.1 flagellar hook-associated protein FlgK [Ectothiorhodospira variabilis]MCG5505859.1 flagellar hook-associated protein FlgK [Ectothiorhodospira variabilis]